MPDHAQPITWFTSPDRPVENGTVFVLPEPEDGWDGDDETTGETL
jgi:hypothetical protein